MNKCGRKKESGAVGEGEVEGREKVVRRERRSLKQ